MNKLEKNLVESFRRARSDIVKLQEQVMLLAQNQARLMEEFSSKSSSNKTRSSTKKKKR